MQKPHKLRLRPSAFLIPKWNVKILILIKIFTFHVGITTSCHDERGVFLLNAYERVLILTQNWKGKALGSVWAEPPHTKMGTAHFFIQVSQNGWVSRNMLHCNPKYMAEFVTGKLLKVNAFSVDNFHASHTWGLSRSLSLVNHTDSLFNNCTAGRYFAS